MDPMTIIYILVSFIIGLIVDQLLPSYFSQKGKNLADKEDIAKITGEIEQVKNIHRNRYDLSRTEREFYNEMILKIQNFLVALNRYELDYKPISNDVVMNTPELREKYLEFIDNVNEMMAKAYIFLNEESYIALHDSLGKEINFSTMRQNFLNAMRKSIHTTTKLDAKTASVHFKYIKN